MLARCVSDEAFRAYLVAGRDQCADEAGNDHDLVDQQGVEYGRPWHASCQEQVQEQKWCSDNPKLISLASSHCEHKHTNRYSERRRSREACQTPWGWFG